MIISVASGKGGTGKTLIATSLAHSLNGRDTVQFLDCDVEEPDAHIFLKPVITKREPVCILAPEVDSSRCTYCGRCADICAYHAIAVLPEQVMVFANLCHGCGACSYLCPENAISEVGKEIGLVESGRSNGLDFMHGKLTVGEAMPTPLIRKVKQKTTQDGTVIIDVPPGTSCPVVQSLKGSDFCLLVTEPTPFGLNDLILAIETTKELKIPCGVVINRAGTGDDRVERYCAENNIPVLLTIPFDRNIARLYSSGIAMVDGMPWWKRSFVELFDNIQRITHERSCGVKR